MHELMQKIGSGQATEADMVLVNRLGNNMKKICLSVWDRQPRFSAYNH